MSVEVELVDGPLDGQIRTVEGDPMAPPRDIVFLQLGHIGFSSPGDEPVGYTNVVYVCEASPRDVGPLWLYRWSPTP
jgi:hypothetical protein